VSKLAQKPLLIFPREQKGGGVFLLKKRGGRRRVLLIVIENRWRGQFLPHPPKREGTARRCRPDRLSSPPQKWTLPKTSLGMKAWKGVSLSLSILMKLTLTFPISALVTAKPMYSAYPFRKTFQSTFKGRQMLSPPPPPPA